MATSEQLQKVRYFIGKRFDFDSAFSNETGGCMYYSAEIVFSVYVVCFLATKVHC